MRGSIGDIAEQVLEEVRSSKLTKVAQYEILKEEESKPRARTKVGKLLLKLSEDVRLGNEDITVEELDAFVTGVQDAIKTS